MIWPAGIELYAPPPQKKKKKKKKKKNFLCVVSVSYFIFFNCSEQAKNLYVLEFRGVFPFLHP